MIKIFIWYWLFKFQPRTIHIGVCLPTSCGEDDVFTIAEFAGRKLDTKSVEIKDVRIPNADGFSVWNDGTFLTMLLVSHFVFLKPDFIQRFSSTEQFRSLLEFLLPGEQPMTSCWKRDLKSMQRTWILTHQGWIAQHMIWPETELIRRKAAVLESECQLGSITIILTRILP